MTTVKEKHAQHLRSTFNGRVNFDHTERKLYGHDIGDMPKLIKPLVGKTIPDAVVQPESEKELSDLVTWAKTERIALTPRGKATSGYGGVLPVKRGIVVDFYRMRRVLHIDKENLIARVEPGISWEHLDKALEKEGLTLKLYPTSYLGSTVGGWLAQGGAGIGSYESGWFRENVVSARVVIPTGEVREFAGSDLDLISDAEGVTGLISEVTIMVQPAEALDVIGVLAGSEAQFQRVVSDIAKEDLPIWSILFINPKMAELRNESPVREHLGHPAEHKHELPDGYIATIAFRSKDSDAVRDGVLRIAKDAGASFVDEEIVAHEWENRFKIMLVKRLGPSLVPAEIVVPLENLAEVLEEIRRKIAQPVVKEGIVIKHGASGKPEVVLLGFIPADQRKFSYHFVFSLSLSITKIAEKYGGRAYATGLYFKNKAKSIFGQPRIDALKDFKQKYDPSGIMNPGKLFGTSLVSGAIVAAQAMEPMTRVLGNNTKSQVGVRINKPVKGIPADVAWHAYSCSQCGFCVDECDQFYGRGWESQSPRGKWYFLRELMEGREKWDQKMVDTFLVCTTCETCNLRCSESLPIETSWMKLRGKLIHEEKKMTFPPFEMMAAALASEGNIWAGYRKKRLEWFPEDLREKHGPGKQAKAVYFTGCTASYVEHDIAIASVRILDEAGVDFTHVGEGENCCGTPMLVAGKWELFGETLKKNIELVKATGADTVISSCPACDMMWRHVYPEWAKKLGISYDLTAKHYSEVVTEKIESGEFTIPKKEGSEPERVTWHDSCHMGRVTGVYEPPRDLLRANPNCEFVEMASNRDEGKCCGSVLTLIKEPDVAAVIGEHRLSEAVDIKAEKVLALCPCCEFQLRVSADKKKTPVEVVDLARYTAEALGYELPDPNPEVKKQWAVFEAMIDLMTPKGFAEIMSSMWPELVDAMPMGMGGMMRFFGKIPFALNMMKPMFPVLFPILLPKMMPKVMPTMLDRVADKIPMPDYMAEQMPDLMPKVMDNLMPHMIGEVVTLVTDPMVDYLQGRQ
jgi:Fe-S oxidoreductase/FAD/FMN-containing dehydrogenase